MRCACRDPLSDPILVEPCADLGHSPDVRVARQERKAPVIRPGRTLGKLAGENGQLGPHTDQGYFGLDQELTLAGTGPLAILDRNLARTWEYYRWIVHDGYIQVSTVLDRRRSAAVGTFAVGVTRGSDVPIS